MRKLDYQFLAAACALLASAILAAPAAAQPAAAPFAVFRATDPASVSSAPMQAQPMVAPFDDASGTLSDGNTYFYVVRNGQGADVPLSVQKNAVLDAVRLGFDDGDPASATVDRIASSVSVVPSSIPADGASMAIVTVVPVDMDGVPLGTGLAVVVDAVALLPGLVAGNVRDEGDGSYSLAVLSSTPGAGNVVVEVEGTTLSSQPLLNYEPVGPSVCGDGYVDTANFETCDDGNIEDGDACPSTCETATCGDGFVWNGVEECDGGPSCNPDCTVSSCGTDGSLSGCTPPNALLVLIAEFQERIDADPTAPVSAELQLIAAYLQAAYDLLTQPTPNVDQAKASINLAIGRLDDAVGQGLNPLYAWIKALQMIWIASQI